MPNIFRTERGLQTSNLISRRSTKTRIRDKCSDLQGQRSVKVARQRDAFDRCLPISRERNDLETPKLVGMLFIKRAIMRLSFEVKGQRSRSPGPADWCSHSKCAISSEREGLRSSNLIHRRSRKTPHQQPAPWPPKLKVKVARSRDASDRCWPISQSRNVPETPKLVGRLSTPRAIGLLVFYSFV